MKKKKNGKKKIKLFGKTMKAMAKEMASRERKAFKGSRETGQAFIDLSESFQY